VGWLADGGKCKFIFFDSIFGNIIDGKEMYQVFEVATPGVKELVCHYFSKSDVSRYAGQFAHVVDSVTAGITIQVRSKFHDEEGKLGRIMMERQGRKTRKDEEADGWEGNDFNMSF
jgi:hypothetical protein